MKTAHSIPALSFFYSTTRSEEETEIKFLFLPNDAVTDFAFHIIHNSFRFY